MSKKAPPKPKTTTPPTEAPKPGRPPGSPTTTATAQAQLSRCPKCHSTNREPYMGVPVVNHFHGLDPETKKPYTRILTRRTRCRDCGQARRDKTREYHPADIRESLAEE